MKLSYLYAKFFKKVVRGKSVINSTIDKKAKVYSGSLIFSTKIDKYSYIGYDSDIISADIGSYCSIANGVNIGGANHPLEYVSTSPVFYKDKGGTGYHLGNLNGLKTKRTFIGNDVWIGQRAIIMQGVTIGTGAVIGAGAIVTKDVPPYAIVAGCPATIIRYRFDKKIINRLQTSEWWLLPDDKLRVLAKYMNEPEQFLMELDKTNNLV